MTRKTKLFQHACLHAWANNITYRKLSDHITQQANEYIKPSKQALEVQCDFIKKYPCRFIGHKTAILLIICSVENGSRVVQDNKARKIGLMAEDYWIFGCLAERVSTKNTITASLYIFDEHSLILHYNKLIIQSSK